MADLTVLHVARGHGFPDDFLETHEQAIARIDIEIESLLRNVRRLQFRKAQHMESIKHYKGSTTLARRLPPELLTCIFEDCIHDGWTRTPLTASHVCSEWRKATRIPTLWSHIYINSDAKDPYRRTLFWLENSKGSPLQITMDVRNNLSQMSGIMDLLLSHIQQWRIFTVNSILLHHANHILSLCNRPAPELRIVNVSVVEEYLHDLDQPDIDDGHELVGMMGSFPEAPHFHTVRLSRNILPSHGTVPSSITNLSIDLMRPSLPVRSSVDKVLRLLEGLPALRNLSIALQYYGEERQFIPALDENRRVVLPELRSLVLNGSPDIFRIVSHLSTPSLTRLHLRSTLELNGHAEEETGSYVRQFLERASPPLDLFELHDMDLSLSDLSACLGAVPRLKELRLHESDISDSIIQQLHGPEALCPLLHKLDLRWCGQVTGRALVKLVHARRVSSGDGEDHTLLGNGSVPIDSITIINCAFVEEQDIIDIAQTIICRIVMQADDYCRRFGCCQNDRYRRRLELHQIAAMTRTSQNQNGVGKLIA